MRRPVLPVRVRVGLDEQEYETRDGQGEQDGAGGHGLPRVLGEASRRTLRLGDHERVDAIDTAVRDVRAGRRLQPRVQRLDPVSEECGALGQVAAYTGAPQTRQGALTAEGILYGDLGWRADPRQGEIMAVGPVDVYIIGFPGNKFSGRIAPAIMELVGERHDPDTRSALRDEGRRRRRDDRRGGGHRRGRRRLRRDRRHAAGCARARRRRGGQRRPPANSSALLIAFENLWVGKVVDALRAADAVLIDSIRIPVDVVEAFEAS